MCLVLICQLVIMHSIFEVCCSTRQHTANMQQLALADSSLKATANFVSAGVLWHMHAGRLWLVCLQLPCCSHQEHVHAESQLFDENVQALQHAD